jgi:hypothetical protein
MSRTCNDCCMSAKLRLTLFLAAAFLGGFVSNYLAPRVVRAQANTPFVSTAPLLTDSGKRLGDLQFADGVFKITIRGAVQTRLRRDATSVSLEISEFTVKDLK